MLQISDRLLRFHKIGCNLTLQTRGDPTKAQELHVLVGRTTSSGLYYTCMLSYEAPRVHSRSSCRCTCSGHWASCGHKARVMHVRV